jgi:hypothetical protein
MSRHHEAISILRGHRCGTRPAEPDRSHRSQVGASRDAPAPSPPGRCAPRRVRFGPQHIAQHLLPEQVAEHLADFSDIPERLLRRAAAARLAQICLGGPAAVAAEQLGTPLVASRYAFTTLDGQLRTRRRRAAFDAAIDALAYDLDTTPLLTDFGRRRDALKAWSLNSRVGRT